MTYRLPLVCCSSCPANKFLLLCSLIKRIFFKRHRCLLQLLNFCFTFQQLPSLLFFLFWRIGNSLKAHTATYCTQVCYSLASIKFYFSILCYIDTAIKYSNLFLNIIYSTSAGIKYSNHNIFMNQITFQNIKLIRTNLLLLSICHLSLNYIFHIDNTHFLQFLPLHSFQISLKPNHFFFLYFKKHTLELCSSKSSWSTCSNLI